MSPPAENCFHCGLPAPAGSTFAVVVDGIRRPMCCAGCEAVAQTITAYGLGSYYRSRTAFAPRMDAPALGDLALYDRQEVQRGFVHREADASEVTLLLEGITCAACVWLNERHIAGLPGVLSVEANYTTHRARVRWDPRRVQLSQILRAIERIGYHAFPATNARTDEIRRRETRAALWRLFVAGFGMMQVMMYALPTYLAQDGTMSADILQLMHIAAFVLTMPVVIYSAAPFFLGAWRDLRLRRLGMDVPVALGVGTAFVASTVAAVTGHGEVYFDSITMFVFFLLGARYLEMRARHTSAASLEYLDRAIPLGAHRLVHYPVSRDTEEVPAVSLAPGDTVLVRTGEAVPADGGVLEGETEVDESLLTGESRPVAKVAGAALVAGSINRLHPVIMRVEGAGEATRASHIRRLTERAASERPRLIELTDRVAAWFVATVLVVAGGAALAWLQIEPARALWVAVAVLVITCPCALSLAAPAALAVSIGALARRGVAASSGRAVAVLARASHVVFDKTGTLTLGQLGLKGLELFDVHLRSQVLAVAAGLEQGSEHPIAKAVLAAAAVERVTPTPIQHLRSVAGAGLEGSVDGVAWRIGHAQFVGALCGRLPLSSVPADVTEVWLGNANGVAAVLTFTDTLRPEAHRVVRALAAQGRQILILSGDRSEAVQTVARQLGVTHAEGGLSPEAKHERVCALEAAGAVVAMVGDGVNDAPVLARAQVSVAMGSGALLSQTHADLVLLEGRLPRLLDAFAVSARTMRIVRENLLWATFYNLVALPFAVAGWITPWMAGIGMGASSLLVVLNALRLLEVPTPSRVGEIDSTVVYHPVDS